VPSAHELSLELPATQQSPRAAREAVDSLPLSNDLEATFNLRLLVTELVTNSVRHAGQPVGAPVHIRATAVDDVVRIEVHDHGHGPVRPGAPGPRPGGFGLQLVNQLAARRDQLTAPIGLTKRHS